MYAQSIQVSPQKSKSVTLHIEWLVSWKDGWHFHFVSSGLKHTIKKLICLFYQPLKKIIVMEAKAFTLQLPQTPPFQFNTSGKRLSLIPWGLRIRPQASSTRNYSQGNSLCLGDSPSSLRGFALRHTRQRALTLVFAEPLRRPSVFSRSGDRPWICKLML